MPKKGGQACVKMTTRPALYVRSRKTQLKSTSAYQNINLGLDIQLTIFAFDTTICGLKGEQD